MTRSTTGRRTIVALTLTLAALAPASPALADAGTGQPPRTEPPRTEPADPTLRIGIADPLGTIIDIIDAGVDQEGKCKPYSGGKKIKCWLKVLFGKCRPTAPTPLTPNAPYGVTCNLS